MTAPLPGDGDRALRDRVAQLEAEVVRLRDRESLLSSRCGQLMVDADRREERARQEAHDCAAHGREIQYLRHMASWQWDSANESQSAYRGLISALILVSRGLTGEPVAAGVLAGWLSKAIDAGNKHLKHGFPSLADCLRAGGCDHDGLCDGLAAEITAALGSVEPARQMDLFGAVA